MKRIGGRGNPVPDAVRQAALARVQAGESGRSVAMSLGLSRNAVANWAHAAGIKVRGVGRRARPLLGASEDVARSMARAAAPYGAIIEATGIARHTVVRIVAEEQAKVPGLRAKYRARSVYHAARLPDGSSQSLLWVGGELAEFDE